MCTMKKWYWRIWRAYHVENPSRQGSLMVTALPERVPNSIFLNCTCILSDYTIDWVVPPPSTVTTRITFLVGDPYKPSFVTVTGRGDDPKYRCLNWNNSPFLRTTHRSAFILGTIRQQKLSHKLVAGCIKVPRTASPFGFQVFGSFLRAKSTRKFSAVVKVVSVDNLEVLTLKTKRFRWSFLGLFFESQPHKFLVN